MIRAVGDEDIMIIGWLLPKILLSVKFLGSVTSETYELYELASWDLKKLVEKHNFDSTKNELTCNWGSWDCT